MASIVVISGPQEGEYYELGRGTNVVGRSPAASIHILDVTISREHMKVCFDEAQQQYFVEDMRSRHGVFVNDLKVNGKMEVAEGDCIALGQTVLLFTLENVADRASALLLCKKSKLNFPTIDLPVNPAQGSGNRTIHKDRRHSNNFRQWAGSTKTTLAIVFTDIIDSASLTNSLGNECMDQIRRAHFARARNLIEQFSGYEIKTNGDEFMVAFRTAMDALDFAIEFHADTGDERVAIRAGVHIGPVIVEEEDMHGAAVSYAARIVDMAAAGGVWLSNEVKNHIDQEKATRHQELCWQNYPGCELKGFPGKHLLWSVRKEG